VLDDLAIFGKPEDVYARPIAITGPVLEIMQHNVVALGNNAPKFDLLAGIVGRRLLEIVDETLLAVSHPGIVLTLFGPDVALDGLPRAALVEHQVVEGDDVLLVAFKVTHGEAPATGRT
jgi:hypothetical protein